MLQKGGQAILAGVDPTKTYEQVKEETGFPSLKGEKLEQIRELLKAENTAEKAGKVTEFLAELVWPTGKTKEAQMLLRKGKEVVETG